MLLKQFLTPIQIQTRQLLKAGQQCLVTLNTTAYGAIYLLNVSLKAAKTARVFPIIIP